MTTVSIQEFTEEKENESINLQKFCCHLKAMLLKVLFSTPGLFMFVLVTWRM